MFKKTAIATGLLFTILPLFASAQTACPNLARNLSYGSRGNDVTALQRFLIAQNILASDSATGYFGNLTQAAVQTWQRNNGIVSSGTPTTNGFGAVGPKTRAAFARNCGGAAQNTVNTTVTSQAAATGVTSFTSSITVGYTVKFEGSLPWSLGAKEIDFGDGTSQGIPVPCGWDQPKNCPLPSLPISQSHTYSAAGTYQARIKDIVRGTILANTVVVIKTPLTSTQPTPTIPNLPDADGFTANPNTGSAPLTVTFTLNGIGLSAGTTLEFGDGTSGVMQSPSYGGCSDGGSCAAPTYIATHTYASSGTYLAKLVYTHPAFVIQDCYPWEDCTPPPQITDTIGSANITVGTSSVLPPPTPTTPVQPTVAAFNQQKALSFIKSLYDSNQQLLKECPTCSRYWLWSDQLVGQMVLKNSDPILAATIENKMNSFGVPMRSAWATLDSQYIANTSFQGTRELQVGNSVVWYSDYGGGGDLACSNYADIAFLKAIYKFKTGDTLGARTCYDLGKAMWDGVGMKDAGQITGQYAVYKTALGLLAQKITGFPAIGIPDNYFDRFQAANGGITTDITNGQPSGSQNIETTAAVLMAKNPALLSTIEPNSNLAIDTGILS